MKFRVKLVEFFNTFREMERDGRRSRSETATQKNKYCQILFLSHAHVLLW